ncbi:hypothetical protein FB451DRAFT_1513064 [Mycena latifolia]|nr:hypothetical protein FB451DRAFT_1513064 [Mycena latifolia]
MRDNLISQLQTSILLGALSLIPNDALRYTLFMISACLAIFYVIYLKRPSALLSQLEHIVQTTEEIIRDAKLRYPRDLLSLTEVGVRLLRVKRSASMIQCRLLETTTLTWKEYRLLSRDISDCFKNVGKIRTAVELDDGSNKNCTGQLIVEAERQRRYTEDINEIEIMLTSMHSPGSDWLVSHHNVGNAQSSIYPSCLVFPRSVWFLVSRRVVLQRNYTGASPSPSPFQQYLRQTDPATVINPAGFYVFNSKRYALLHTTRDCCRPSSRIHRSPQAPVDSAKPARGHRSEDRINYTRRKNVLVRGISSVWRRRGCPHLEKYRLLSRDISICTKKVKEIRTAIQLIIEAECQRKYTDDINETEIILVSVCSSPDREMLVSQPNISNVKSCIHGHGAPVASPSSGWVTVTMAAVAKGMSSHFRGK